MERSVNMPEGFELMTETPRTSSIGGVAESQSIQDDYISQQIVKNKAAIARPVESFQPQGSVADAYGQGLGAFGDEAAGVMGGIAGFFDPRLSNTTFKDRYVGVRDAARDNAKAYAEREPAKNFAAEALAASLPISKGLKIASAAATPARKMMAGSLAGLAEGGAFGWGAGEGDAQSQATSAAIGGTTGAVVGGVVPMVAPLYKYIKNNFFPDTAEDKVIAALKNDGYDISREDGARALQERFDSLGPDGQVADVGINTQRLTDTTQSTPGVAKTQINDVLDTRQAGRNDRVTKATYDELGDAEEFLGDMDTQIQKKYAEAAPLYDKAYAVAIEPTDALSELLSRTASKKAYKEAARLADNEGRKIPSLDEIFPNDGTTPKLGTQTLDEIKRGLDTLIERNTDAVTGKVNSQGRSLTKLKNELLAEVDSQNPDYAAARANYAGNQSMENAAAQGRRFLRDDSDLTIKQLKSMTPSEQEFFRKGAAKSIRDRILSAQDGADAFRRVFGNEAMRERIRAVMPDDAAFKRFEQQMRRESDFASTRAQVKGNSLTNERQIAGAEVLDKGVISALWNSAGKIIRDFKGTDGEKARKLASILVDADPQSIARLKKRAEKLTPRERSIYRKAIEAATLSSVAVGEKELLEDR